MAKLTFNLGLTEQQMYVAFKSGFVMRKAQLYCILYAYAKTVFKGCPMCFCCWVFFTLIMLM